MKCLHSSFLLGFILVYLTACSSGPKITHTSVGNAATIQGHTANVFNFFWGDEAHVDLLELDGVETEASPYRLSPGSHTLYLSAAGDKRQLESNVQVNLKPNTEYKFTAQTAGNSMVAKLWDITSDTPVLVKTYNLGATQPATPFYIPVAY